MTQTPVYAPTSSTSSLPLVSSGASEPFSVPPAGTGQPPQGSRIRGNVSISPARIVVPSRRQFWGRNWEFFGQIRLSDPIRAGTAPTPARSRDAALAGRLAALLASKAVQHRYRRI